MQRVLIVDDDKSLRSALSIMLGNAGYATSEAKDGIEALKSFDDQHPDLVIMDIMLPRLNGIQACSVIRKMSPEVPLLFLSAKNTISDKAAGFHSGDDYLTKPFSLPELGLRVVALLRRTMVSQDAQHSAASVGSMLTNNGELIIDPSRLEALWRGSSVRLSEREYKLLNLLMTRPGQIVRYEEMLRAGWQNDPDADTAHLRVAAARIRKKLAGLGLNPRVLSSYTNVGYMLGDLTDYDRDYLD